MKISKRIIKYGGLLVLLILFFKYLWMFDPFLAKIHDVISQQNPVTSQAELDKAFESLREIPFDNLPTDVKTQLHIDGKGKCAKSNLDDIYASQSFYKVSWFQRYKYVAGKNRIKDFLTPDRLIKFDVPIPFTGKSIPTKNRVRIANQNKVQYWLIDKKILHKIIALNAELKKQELSQAFSITSGFRNPQYNHMVNGKSCSRHQFGDAVDIRVYDINQDDEVNQDDRETVQKILDEKILGNSGGLGNYKNSPFVIHFDSRGYRARWHY